MVKKVKEISLSSLLFYAFWVVALFVGVVLARNFYETKFCYKTFKEYLGSENMKESMVFLSKDNSAHQMIFKTIYDNMEYDVSDVRSEGKITSFTLECKVRSFAAAANKKFPALFTYARKDFFITQTGQKGEEAYTQEIYDTLNNELTNSNVAYSFTMQMAFESIGNKQYVLIDAEDLENQLLGNIYSYQNNDCQFLTLNELIYPDGRETMKTEGAEVASLFTKSVSPTTFSSVDVPIIIGDEASIQFVTEEGDVATLNISLKNIVSNKDETMSATFAIASDIPVDLTPQLFSAYNIQTDTMESSVSNDLIKIDEAGQINLSFGNKSDIIIFSSKPSADAEKLYFSTLPVHE